jgi:sulfonate transport system ATP-binding protein
MLRLDGLAKTYADGTAALAGIDLAVGASEIVALVGGSGCGKTTLLRLLAGLDVPSAGTINLDGEPVIGPHPGIGIVFQEPRLMPWLSVAQNVGFGLRHRPARERQELVAHALGKVGLGAHARRWPRELSGGQQQRAAVARALATAPRLLLLDEPFSALDAITRASLHAHLLTLWDEHRPMVVLVTHEVSEAVTLADRVLIMRPRPGRIEDAITLDLPRPRSPTSRAFEGASRRVLASLHRSLTPSRPPSGVPAQDSAALWW